MERSRFIFESKHSENKDSETVRFEMERQRSENTYLEMEDGALRDVRSHSIFESERSENKDSETERFETEYGAL